MTTQLAVAAALVATTTGCFVLTGTVTTARRVGTIQTEPLAGTIHDIQLDAAARDAQIVVHATADRTCSRQILQVWEVREHEHLRAGGAEDPRAQVFGLALAPVTLPVSLAISGIRVAASTDKTTRRTRIDHVLEFPCTRPLATGVALELPSGARVRASTDQDGSLSYAIPSGEPYDGTVMVRLGTQSREVAYHRPMPALALARDAVRTCAGHHHVGGKVELTIAIDPSGHATRVITAAGDAFGACVGAQIVGHAFPYRGVKLVLPFELAGGVS